MSAQPIPEILFKEIFLEKKCGVDNKTHDAYFNWCAGFTSRVKAKCVGITGSSGMSCDLDLRYYPENINLDPPDFPEVPKGIIYSAVCPNDVQPEKSIIWPATRENFPSREEYMKYNLVCYQELFGVPYSMPWWVMVLIILATILFVSLAGTMFWKYYLRAKISKKKSTLDNQFTSAPVSNVSQASNLVSGGASGSHSNRKHSQMSRSSQMPKSNRPDLSKSSSSRANQVSRQFPTSNLIDSSYTKRSANSLS